MDPDAIEGASLWGSSEGGEWTKILCNFFSLPLVYEGRGGHLPSMRERDLFPLLGSPHDEIIMAYSITPSSFLAKTFSSSCGKGDPFSYGWGESLIEEMMSEGMMIHSIVPYFSGDESREEGLLISYENFYAILIPSEDQEGISLVGINQSPDSGIFLEGFVSSMGTRGMMFPSYLAAQILRFMESGGCQKEIEAEMAKDEEILITEEELKASNEVHPLLKVTHPGLRQG